MGEGCYGRRAVRNSMGAIFTLPIINVSSLARSLRDLRSTYSVRTIAAHPRADRKTLYRTDLRHDVCIVFGSEGVGISNSVLEACDESVAVPMNEGIDSLNVPARAPCSCPRRSGRGRRKACAGRRTKISRHFGRKDFQGITQRKTNTRRARLCNS